METILARLRRARVGAVPPPPLVGGPSEVPRPEPRLRDPVVGSDGSLAASNRLPGFDADLETRAAMNVAHLLVMVRDDGALRVTGLSGRDEIGTFQGVIDPPSLALGNLAADAGEEVGDLLDLMFEWSRIVPGLREWIQNLRRSVGDNELHLHVRDETGLEIPWELLTLPPLANGEEPTFLGASISVTRHLGCLREFDLAPVAPEVQGVRVASVSADMAADLVWLEHFPHELIDDAGLLDFLRARRAEEPITSLYVACHGEYGGSLTRMTLGPAKYADYSRSRFPSMETMRPWVFLNACHAGRMVTDARIGRTLIGFAEVFLRLGASSVIAPTGRVGSDVASLLAARLFEELATGAGSIAHALRNARIATIVELADDEEGKRGLVYAFMFVCYADETNLDSGAL